MNPSKNTLSPRAAARASLLSAALVLGGVSLHADDFFLVDGNTSGEDWNTLGDWNSQSDGSGTAPSSISSSDDFFTNGTSPLRTPTSSGASFGGNSLTFGGGSGVLLKAYDSNGGGTPSATVPDLRIGSSENNLIAGNNPDSRIQTLAATNLDMQGNRLDMVAGEDGSGNPRQLGLDIGTLSGGSSSLLPIGVGGTDTGNYFLSAQDGSGFLGEVRHIRSSLTFNESFSAENAILETLDQNTGSITLNANVSVGAFEIGDGNAIAPDTYTASELESLASTTTFSGSETLTVVPEPSATALMLGTLAVGGAFAARRRARR